MSGHADCPAAEAGAKSRRWRIATLWLGGWLCLMFGGGWLLLGTRGRMLDERAQAEARSDWQAWKQAVERQDPELGPVARRPLKSDEPPAIVLLRDYFPAVAVGSGVFVSLTYLFFAVAVSGLFATKTTSAAGNQRGRPQ